MLYLTLAALVLLLIGMFFMVPDRQREQREKYQRPAVRLSDDLKDFGSGVR